MVDHLLGSSLNLGVATLHRIKVQGLVVHATAHGARCTTAKANSHARPTYLKQQSPRGIKHLFDQLSVNAPQATRNHDGLVVAALNTVDPLLILSKETQQIGPTKFIVKGRTAKGAVDHDL